MKWLSKLCTVIQLSTSKFIVLIFNTQKILVTDVHSGSQPTVKFQTNTHISTVLMSNTQDFWSQMIRQNCIFLLYFLHFTEFSAKSLLLFPTFLWLFTLQQYTITKIEWGICNFRERSGRGTWGKISNLNY